MDLHQLDLHLRGGRAEPCPGEKSEYQTRCSPKMHSFSYDRGRGEYPDSSTQYGHLQDEICKCSAWYSPFLSITCARLGICDHVTLGHGLEDGVGELGGAG